MKKLKNLFSNKPWKDVKTRKLAFTYCVIGGTLAIIFGAALIPFDKFDSTVWLTESLKFFKWVITTGTVIVLLSSTKDVIKFLQGRFGEEEDDEEINEVE